LNHPEQCIPVCPKQLHPNPKPVKPVYLARPDRADYICNRTTDRTPQLPMEARDIENLIRESFPKARITITDLAGDGNHWAAEVIDESFKGMNRVQQQRAVYASLKGKMDGAQGELHALALTTKAPD
jgi:stress-induced morphogen